MKASITILMAWVLLCFPTGAAAQKGFGDEDPSAKGGPVAASKAFAMPDLPGQEQAAALKKQYAAAVKERLSEIRIAIDPLYIEQLQKEISELKAEEEKAQMELQLEFALQNGEEGRAVELEKELNHFYGEKKVRSVEREVKQVPGMSTFRSWTKNPDDR